MKRIGISLAALGAFLGCAFAQPSGETLADYWPFGMKPKTWSLRNKVGRVSMVVTYSSPSKDTLYLIFQHPQNPAFDYGGAGFHIGQQRYCANNGDPYLFLDAYKGFNGDGSLHERHNIVSTKLILTPAGGEPIDLIANGTYARCGGVGQPYMRWRLGRYRLQAWGALAENPRDKWYWDVQVDGPVDAVNPCVTPAQHFTAVTVQEAWWTNFDKKQPGWSVGQGALGGDGAPTGASVNYGRTDWHAKGFMPWYMVASTAGSRMCAVSTQEGTNLPLGQLAR